MNGNPIRSSYPLHWPQGWERHKGTRKQSGFASRTLAQAREELLAELRRWGAHSVTLSTNVPTMANGLPRSGLAQPADPGVAVYFRRKGEDYALACDRWRRIEENLFAMAKHIDAVRAQERYGVGTDKQALQGYKACLPAQSTIPRDWWEVLGVSAEATRDEIRKAYEDRALVNHPDQGGPGGVEFIELLFAYRAANVQLANKEATMTRGTP